VGRQAVSFLTQIQELSHLRRVKDGAPCRSRNRVSQGGRSAHTTNNVPVPISACAVFLHRLRQLPIETRDNLRATPQSGDNAQTTCLSLYLRLCRMFVGGRQDVQNQVICPHIRSKRRGSRGPVTFEQGGPWTESGGSSPALLHRMPGRKRSCAEKWPGLGLLLDWMGWCCQ